jgi:hypothetical protein
MAQVITFSRPMTRDKLASFLPNQEAIKAFEDLQKDVAGTLPGAISQITIDFDTIKLMAENAKAVADAALEMTNNLAILLTVSQEQSSYISALQAQINQIYSQNLIKRE